MQNGNERYHVQLTIVTARKAACCPGDNSSRVPGEWRGNVDERLQHTPLDETGQVARKKHGSL